MIEVAENQEESFDHEGSVMMESVDERQPIKKSFTNEELESNKLNWANTKLNPFIEDVFSLGLTVLQAIYQCSGPELKQMRQDPESLTRSVE